MPLPSWDVLLVAAGLCAVTAILVWLVVKAVEQDNHPSAAASSAAASASPAPQRAALAADVTTDSLRLVLIYREGCPACKPVVPVFEALQREFGERRVNLMLSPLHQSFVRANNIARVPTIAVVDFSTGKIKELFAGPRTIDALRVFGQAHQLW